MKKIIPTEIIERKIYLIRGQKVMLSMHLAELYGVETRALNQAVKRNINRFPEDFMFQINESEAEQLVSQNVIPHKRKKLNNNMFKFIRRRWILRFFGHVL